MANEEPSQLRKQLERGLRELEYKRPDKGEGEPYQYITHDDQARIAVELKTPIVIPAGNGPIESFRDTVKEVFKDKGFEIPEIGGGVAVEVAEGMGSLATGNGTVKISGFSLPVVPETSTTRGFDRTSVSASTLVGQMNLEALQRQLHPQKAK